MTTPCHVICYGMLLTVAEYLTAVSHTLIIENYKGELLHVPQICVQMLHKDSQAICETNKMHVVIKLNRQQISANNIDKKNNCQHVAKVTETSETCKC